MRLTVCLLALISLVGLVVADDLPDGVENTQNPDDVSLSPQESLSRIQVPEGYNVTLFAGEPDIRRPIAFDFDDRGRLWVVENYSHPNWNKDNATDRVIILEDTDHDGEFDQRTVFWDQGRYLTGIAYGHGGVWLANTPELIFIPDRDGDDVPDSEPIVMLDGFQISTNNVVNNFHWGPDGWLYGAIGLSAISHVGGPGAPDHLRTPISRGIWRFHPVSHRFEKVAEGMVNPWGADFNEYGDLFTSNTVIAHLWHIVPGMYCARRLAERDNPYAYDRVQSITNHLHWGGGNWQSSRNPSSRGGQQRQPAAANENQNDHHDEQYERHSVSGGGHAHCGAMIYLGDNWPDQYRGSFFTNNLHGNRVNNDRLLPSRSTYVGEHADDILLGNDPWFRGMSIKYGPDGGVYVTDWHDFGECHDTDGSHRTTGRIYKVVYGESAPREIDLQKLSSLELAKLQNHRNAWFARHARRLLHERFVRDEDLSEAVEHLISIVEDDSDEVRRLRALWALPPREQMVACNQLLEQDDQSEHLRRWAIRLITDQADSDMSFAAGAERHWLPAARAAQLTLLAQSERSAKVRLELASVLQRMDHQDRVALAKELLAHGEDATDPYIPLMIWYGLEPAVADHATEALRVAASSRIPAVRQYIAQRLADLEPPPLELLVEAANSAEQQVALDLLTGMTLSLKPRGSQQAPQSWDRLHNRISVSNSDELRSLGLQLSLIFGSQDAIDQLRRRAMDPTAELSERRNALRSLLKIDQGISVEQLHELVQLDGQLRGDAILALLQTHDESTAAVLLNQFSSLTSEEKRNAVSVLVTRRQFALSLLAALDEGVVTRSDVSAFALQQLRAFDDDQLQQRVGTFWSDEDTSIQKANEIVRLNALMTPEHLQSGNPSAGRALFDQTCSKCHTLFGEGGTIAPDLTGSGRKQSDYVIRNLIDPSEEIDAAYRLTNVQTEDGRLFSGFIVQQDDHAITVRTQDAVVRLDMQDVEEVATSNVSMMPEGMLNTLTDEQFRDLLAYLASDDQVAAE